MNRRSKMKYTTIIENHYNMKICFGVLREQTFDRFKFKQTDVL